MGKDPSWFNPPASTQPGFKELKSGLVVPSHVVNKFHENSDVDKDKLSQHHTLGTKPNQAAAGDHQHSVGWRGYAFASQGIASGAWTRIAGPSDTSFWPDLETRDKYFGYSGGGLWTCKVAGLYHIVFNFAFTNSNNGMYRFGGISKNTGLASPNFRSQGYPAPAPHIGGGHVTDYMPFKVGDTLGFYVYQDSGIILGIANDNERCNWAVNFITPNVFTSVGF